jgi:flagellar motility protein MotE (MotC chaperone)
MKRRRDFRLLPLLLIAVACLAVLKIASIVLDGGYVLMGEGKRQKLSWAQETLNFPVPGGRIESPDVTGSVEAPKKEEPPKTTEARPAEKIAQAPPQVSPTERAVLERLQERRQELETRAREVDIRESLLKAAEKRIETKVDEMKGVETRISAANQQKEEADNARFKSIVTMYENMKPKDAARVFDRLDMKVLLDVATQINPRRMSDILAQMSPEAAERLTVELATRAKDKPPAELPKIVGVPTN